MREVRFLARARGDVIRVDGWWREQRSAAPEVFRQEIAEAVRLLAERPEVSVVFGERRGESVRRLVLPTSRAHVYYLVRPGCVLILRVWGAARGRPPSLG